MFRVGSVVRESETDPAWQTCPGETGVVVASADEEMGLPGCGRFWMVRIGGEEIIFLDADLKVVS